MKNKQYNIPKISLDIEPVENKDLIEVVSISDVIEVLRSEFSEHELNSKNSTWLIIFDYDDSLIMRSKIMGIHQLMDSDVYLNHQHCKEILQMGLLSNAKRLLVLHSNPEKKILSNSSERALALKFRQLVEMTGLHLWSVVNFNKEDYWAYL